MVKLRVCILKYYTKFDFILMLIINEKHCNFLFLYLRLNNNIDKNYMKKNNINFIQTVLKNI